MGEFNESKRSLSGMEKLSLETNRIPRDLLQSFIARNPSQLAATSMNKEEEAEDSEEIELNLGLSLGGRFGVDKSCEKKKLMRSSSIAGPIPIVRDYDAVARPPPVSYPTIIRTSSLPVETEEEWRKRKELRTLRRMEAKRRRTEKQRISQACAAAQNAILAGRRGNHMGSCGGVSSCNQGFLQPVGSMESQGGSSSGMSESESRPVQGSSSYGEASPGRIQSSEEQANREGVGCSSGAKGRENTSKSSIAAVELPFKIPELEEKQAKERGWLNSMEDMPCVFTRGDGPNGRRIEGILYGYGKGEEVRIMCICHGSFLSPAEFVKHAGGGDVARPLKHIVVNSSSTLPLCNGGD